MGILVIYFPYLALHLKNYLLFNLMDLEFVIFNINSFLRYLFENCLMWGLNNICQFYVIYKFSLELECRSGFNFHDK